MTDRYPARPPIEIFVDADSCPVKEEIYKVALRHEIPVLLVANNGFRIPRHHLIRRKIVTDHFDAADDYIAEHAHPSSIVITADILLADRCLKAEAFVLAPNGKAFSKDSIGGAIATRAIMADLRGNGDQIGGPPPFTKQDRSRFLSVLDLAIIQLAQR
ncbi:MAG: YaiI/YqxD family protein [bacterium]